VILRQKVYINIGPQMLRFQDTGCQTLKNKCVFHKYFKYPLINFVVIWQSHL